MIKVKTTKIAGTNNQYIHVHNEYLSIMKCTLTINKNTMTLHDIEIDWIHRSSIYASFDKILSHLKALMVKTDFIFRLDLDWKYVDTPDPKNFHKLQSSCKNYLLQAYAMWEGSHENYLYWVRRWKRTFDKKWVSYPCFFRLRFNQPLEVKPITDSFHSFDSSDGTRYIIYKRNCVFLRSSAGHLEIIPDEPLHFASLVKYHQRFYITLFVEGDLIDLPDAIRFDRLSYTLTNLQMCGKQIVTSIVSFGHVEKEFPEGLIPFLKKCLQKGKVLNDWQLRDKYEKYNKTHSNSQVFNTWIKLSNYHEVCKDPSKSLIKPRNSHFRVMQKLRGFDIHNEWHLKFLNKLEPQGCVSAVDPDYIRKVILIQRHFKKQVTNSDPMMQSRKREYIYIIHTREFLNSNSPVYKIGRTQNIDRRFNEYAKGSVLIFSSLVHTNIEKAVLNTFKAKYKHRTDLGRELFEGDISSMLKDIMAAVHLSLTAFHACLKK